MSTRSNIILRCGRTVIYLYRHSDGYPSCTGRDLYERLARLRGTDQAYRMGDTIADLLLRELMAEEYPAEGHRKAQPIYELTTELHADIEHLYQIKLEGKAITIHHDARSSLRSLPAGDGFPELTDWINRGADLVMEDFRQLVNREIRATNARIAELRKKDPRAYGSWEDETEIPAAAEAVTP